MLSVFNYLKRIFSWADEGPRKRRATNDLSEIYYVNPKKHCRQQPRMSYNELEEDDGVEIISEFISPSARRKMMNGSHNSSKASRRSHAYSERDSFESLAANSKVFRPPTTLISTTRMLDKKKYNDMLQNYLPDRDRQQQQQMRVTGRESEKEPAIQDVEIIELDKSNTRMVVLPSPRNKNLTHCRQPIAVVDLDDDVTIDVANKSTTPASRNNYSRCTDIRVNSLRDNIANSKFLQRNFTDSIAEKYKHRQELLKKRTKEQERDASAISKFNQVYREANISKILESTLRLCEPFLDDQDEEEEPELPELTDAMVRQVTQAWSVGSPDQVLVNNFGLSVKRRDLQTLANLNWLNDEVINFYTNLIIERGKLDNFPNVHAMNTFFYPKLLQSGHSSLKRWTRKVDIFSMDLIVVPVHLGIHWCMSIIDFRNKTISYYDSMGGNNQLCLNTLRKYLEDESLDKKKQPYDTSDWTLQIVKKIPQQMNGSDCGVFSCMFAEYISANKNITFTQDNMPYFRHKMAYEILHSKLL